MKDTHDLDSIPSTCVLMKKKKSWPSTGDPGALWSATLIMCSRPVRDPVSKKKKNNKVGGAGEAAQRLRALVAFAEDPD